MGHNIQSPNRRLNHLQGVHSRITGGKISKSQTSIPLWRTKGMCTKFDSAQMCLPSRTSRDDPRGTLWSAERQGPADSEPVVLANSTTPLILYRLQKESTETETDLTMGAMMYTFDYLTSYSELCKDLDPDMRRCLVWIARTKGTNRTKERVR